jgi:hypothetical protein
MTTKDRSRTVECPAPCGAIAHRVDTRRTTMPRIIRIRLYRCAGGHQFETAETVVGEVVTQTREKKLINRFSVRRDYDKSRADEYEL